MRILVSLLGTRVDGHGEARVLAEPFVGGGTLLFAFPGLETRPVTTKGVLTLLMARPFVAWMVPLKWTSCTIIAALVGCRPSTLPVVTEDSIVAALQRTGCNGQCPVYRVEVMSSGQVVYEGSAWVKIEGKARARLDATDVERLRAAFESAGFTAFPTGVNPGVDLPMTILEYRTPTGMRKVGQVGLPPPLQQLAREFERIVGTEKWVGTEAERDALPNPEADRIADLIAQGWQPPGVALVPQDASQPARGLPDGGR